MPRMSSWDDFAALGPEIGREYTAALQASVTRKLVTQTEEVVCQQVAASPEDSWAVSALSALLALPDDRRMAVVLHPSFRFWLQAMRRTTGEQFRSLRKHFTLRFADFVWAEQFLLGRLNQAWWLSTDDKGGLRCASLQRFIELGSCYKNEPVQVSGNSDHAVLRCQDGLTIRIPPEDLAGPVLEPRPTLEEHGYQFTLSNLVADGRVELSNRDPWLRVRLTGTNQRNDGTEFFGVDDETYPERSSGTQINAALTLIKRFWPEAYTDFSEHTRVIVPMVKSSRSMRPCANTEGTASQGERVHLAYTVSSRQGAIYIGDAPVDSTVEMLLHENAHVKLRQIQAMDPLLTDPFDETVRLPVPWRPDPRPVTGILEGVFVFSHVAEFNLRRWRAEPGKVSLDLLSKLVNDLCYAVDCLERYASLTGKGSEFLNAMKQWVWQIECRLKHHAPECNALNSCSSF